MSSTDIANEASVLDIIQRVTGFTFAAAGARFQAPNGTIHRIEGMDHLVNLRSSMTADQLATVLSAWNTCSCSSVRQL